MHIVQPGENLYRIGLKYGLTADDIRALNDLPDYDIKVGQELIVSEQLLLNKTNILMGRAKWDDLPNDHKENGIILIDRANRLIKLLELQIKINDGYRTANQTYGAKNSKHRILEAVDLDDNAEGDLWDAIFSNLEMLQYVGLWLEDPRYTNYIGEGGTGKSWIHLQSKPPASGKRIYIPYTGECPNPGFWDGEYDNSLDGFV